MQQGEQKTALITGAARRIGHHLVKCLHGQGYNIILHCNRSSNEANATAEDLNRIRRNSVVVCQAQLLDLSAIETLASDAHNQWNRLDVLINNASTFYPTPLKSISA